MLIVRNEKMITVLINYAQPFIAPNYSTFTKIKIKEEKIWLLLTITVV